MSRSPEGERLKGAWYLPGFTINFPRSRVAGESSKHTGTVLLCIIFVFPTIGDAVAASRFI